MRILMKVKIPNKQFNAAAKDGTAGKKMEQILGELKPEVAYFTEFDGLRTAIVVVNIDEASEIPSVAEPWFLAFGAEVSMHPAMTPEDLGRSGLGELAKKW